MRGQCGWVVRVLVVEAVGMAIKSVFKCVCCKPCVRLYSVVLISDCRLIHQFIDQAVSIHWARPLTTVAAWLRLLLSILFFLSYNLGVVSWDGLFDIRHASVRYFYSISVHNFSQHMVGWKTFIDQQEELFSNVCLNTLWEWWVKPRYFPLPSLFTTTSLAGGKKFQFKVISTAI